MFGVELAYAAAEEEEIVAAGIIAGSTMVIMLVLLALCVLTIIARWKIFTKAGEKGWKSIIPIYSDYVQWRISWKKTGLFWLFVVAIIAGYVLLYASGAYVLNSAGQYVYTGGGNSVIAGIGGLVLIVGAVLSIIAIYKLMKAFGHGGGWTVLYLLFPYIMLLVLGFGSSRYYGPQD